MHDTNESGKNNTAHFVCEDGTVKFYTTRPIEADEELLWDYDEEIETDFEKGVKKRIIQEPKKYVRVVDGKVTLKKAKRSPFNVKNFILQ
ncbi:SET domain-containing protein [Endozoicomonas arenosclerae]|uniref:SET domain-containing protein n=1 Tax=Endozoicomonas arenosclerae TaxID=1633495 RepID=UPI001560F1DC|nr:SET domain-containing protein [Endozoicomonas arenosclerae]